MAVLLCALASITPDDARIDVWVILNASELFANNSSTQKQVQNQSVEFSALRVLLNSQKLSFWVHAASVSPHLWGWWRMQTLQNVFWVVLMKQVCRSDAFKKNKCFKSKCYTFRKKKVVETIFRSEILSKLQKYQVTHFNLKMKLLK